MAIPYNSSQQPSTVSLQEGVTAASQQNPGVIVQGGTPGTPSGYQAYTQPFSAQPEAPGVVRPQQPSDYAEMITTPSRTPSGSQVNSGDRSNAVLNLVNQGLTPDAAQLQRYLNVNQAGSLPTNYSLKEIESILADGKITSTGQQTISPGTITSSQGRQAVAASMNDLTSSEQRIEQERKDRTARLQEQAAAEEADIRRTYDIHRNDLSKTQGEQTKTQDVLSYRLGRKDTPYGQGEMRDLQADQQAQMNKLASDEANLINQAKRALMEGEFAIADKAKEDARLAFNQRMQLEDQYTQKRNQMLNEQKFAVDYGEKMFDAMAKSGAEPSEEVFSWFDQTYGNGAEGLGKALFGASKSEATRKELETKLDTQLKQLNVAEKLQALQDKPLEMEKTKLEIQNMSQQIAKNTLSQVSEVRDIMEKWPAGVPLQIGDASFMGIEGGAVFETSKDGVGRLLYKDPKTGQDRVFNMEFVGDPADLTTVYENGVPIVVNKKTGIQAPITRGVQGQPEDAGWDRIIPTGSVGGQCGAFAHQIVADYPYGLNTLAEKKTAINVPRGEPPEIGDVLIQAIGGSTGHAAVVNWVGQGPGGKTMIRLTESNYRGDERVSNGRTISAEDPTVAGFFRGQLRDEFKTGTDAGYARPGAPQNVPAPQEAAPRVELSYSPSPFITGRQTAAQFQESNQKELAARQAASLVAAGTSTFDEVTDGMSAAERNRTQQILKENKVSTTASNNPVQVAPFEAWKREQESQLGMSLKPEVAKAQYQEYTKQQDSLKTVVNAIGRGKFLNLAERGEFTNQANEAVKNGDYAQLENLATQVALKGMSEKKRENYSSALNLVDTYTSGIQLLNSFAQDPSFRTGNLKRIFEDVKKKGQFDADPRYVQLNQLLSTFQNEYRNNLFGASLTPQEMAEANKAIIDIGQDTPSTAWNKMNTAVKIQQFVADSSIADSLGTPRPKLADYLAR